MNINNNTLISEIVAENYDTATVFKKYGIDFCCNGERTINEVANTKNVSVAKLIQEISLIEINTIASQSYQNWDLDFLSDYIYQNHHLYIEKRGPEIIAYLEKLCKVHGKNHPELFEVIELFKEAVGDLAMHMKKEELILFPHIKKIAKASRQEQTFEIPPFGSIENPIRMMHSEHDNEGERFRRISELTNNYEAPKDACNTYKIAFILLKEFEDDLHKHIHIENNILFKKAITLENQLNK
ncbi:Nitric oxide-dependent regulator DnrN or NorA [Tenacibaculum sp. 190130A14a]|uniref:Regulator of cell morphogenesis and NO signaling n=1 Tax=Tenacibaculum polynesiense TaxID=3137857 RepID=A0ABP1EXE0_9FLAO